MSLVQRRIDTAGCASDYLSLFADCFPETAGTPLQTEAHYRWKYGTPGKVSEVFEFGAFEDTKMVGYYAALPFHYGREGQFVGGLVCDVMTHSAMRGRGMFTKQGKFATSEMADAGIDFVLGFPIRKSVIPGHLKVGWHIAFDLPVFFKLLNPHAPLAARKLAWLSLPAKAISQTYLQVLRFSRRHDRDVLKTDLQSLLGLAEYDDFIREWMTQYVFPLNRTREFLSWRLSAPKSEYQIFVLRVASKLSGIAITRVNKLEGFDALAIVDILVLDEAKSAISSLQDAIEKEARSRNAAAVVVMLPKPEASRLRLYRNGFFRSPVIFQLILKWLSKAPPPERFSDASAWHLTWADTDNL